jgi:hypothetical protein
VDIQQTPKVLQSIPHQLIHTLLLIPLLIVLVTGFRGLDFGWHWDEGNKVEEVAYTLEQGVLLPTYYRKPSLIYWLTLTATLPDVPRFLDRLDLDGANYDDDRPLSVMPALADYIRQPDFMLRVRGWFLMVASLSIIAIYVLLYQWRKRWYEALIAACLIALSWEVAYHLRFVAPDGYLMLFVILTLAGALLYMHQKIPRWLMLSGVMTGCVIASKYNAWAVGFIPVSALLVNQQTDLRVKLWQIITVGLLAGVTFTLLTPGVLLAPEHFLRDVLFEVNHYSSGSVWDTNHDITAGLPHLHASLDYLMWSLFSPYEPIAAVLFCLAIAGMGILWWQNWRIALVITVFPLIYLLYMSSQSVFFVRNLLPIAPFLAIGATITISMLIRHMESRVWRTGIALCLAAIFAMNVPYLFQAAETIQQRNTGQYLTQFIDYAKSQPDTQFAISQQITQQINARGITAPANIQVHAWQTADIYVMRHSDIEWALPTDARHLYRRWFGAHDLNLRYYPRWKGNNHILLMNPQQAQHYNLLHHYNVALE